MKVSPRRRLPGAVPFSRVTPPRRAIPSPRAIPAPRVIPAAALIVAAACTGCGSTANPAGHHGSGQHPGSAASVTAGLQAGTFPVTVTAAGATVRIPARPKAIISLSPTATEMLYAIGAGSQVKAVDANSDYPPGAPRTKLSGFTPNVEAIAGYKPDLVVIAGNTGGLAAKLTALSIPVLQLPAPTGIGGVYTEFSELGAASGHAAQARQEAAAIQRQVAQIVARQHHRGRPLSYYYELDNTYYSLTSATFAGKLLALLGMRSIADAAKGAAAAGGYPQLSAEYIVKAQPEYIILADTLCCHQSAATVSARPGWKSLRAVQAGHIIALNDDIASRWGPRIVDLLRTVADRISGASTR